MLELPAPDRTVARMQRSAIRDSSIVAPDFAGFDFQTANTVIASEAKQSISQRKERRMDCFAEPVIGRAFARPVGSQ
jgi:hypothetical protein